MKLVMGQWIKHQPTVTSFIASVVRDRHHVEDIAQEVASVIAMHVDRYDESRDFLPWALGIARNLVLKYLRSRRRDRLVFDGELLASLAEVHIEQTQGASARKTALHQCLKTLAPETKKLLDKRYFGRIGIGEIAHSIGRTEGAVSMLLFRARQRLAACISKRLATESGESA